MARNKSDIIKFDILVRAETSGESLDVSNIARFRPDPEDVENCRRWLVSKGVACYTNEFGLSCSVSCHLFESLFSTHVKLSKQRSGKSLWQMLTEPVPPPEIADYIEDVTVSIPPDL